jgi:hypothetical protein
VPRDERRCPSCQALASADAAWCGQCFASLDPDVSGAASTRDGTVPGLETGAGEPASDGTSRPAPYWPCPACGERNPIESDACVTCGTPFAALMRTEAEKAEVAPRDALVWSLVFPGLGHRKAGRPADGVARGLLFGVTVGMAILVMFGGGEGGAATSGVSLLLLLAGLGVYGLSAVEAYRLAEGGDLLIPSRMLLWVLVGVIFLAIGLLGLAVVTAARR